jgi:G3E family GTPase
MLVTWLIRQGELEQGGQPAADTSGPDDFGFDRLGKTDLLTSSSPEEIRRYIKQLESRADWLEATLEETLMELERVRRFAPESASGEASPEAPQAAATEQDATASKPAQPSKRLAATKKAAKKKAVRKKVSGKPAPAVDQG